MALILSLNRRIVEFDRALKSGAWVAFRHETRKILRGPIAPLREQTLGIVGFGRIGRTVAQRAAPFGLTILAADPYVVPEEIRAGGAESVALDELLTRADIVTIHCPLTPESRGLLGAERLALMKPSAILVNTARGPIVDIDAAAEALAAGRLAAAGLDVVYPEPLPADHPLYALPNVILTPHAAYYSERSVEIVREQTLIEALKVLQGRRPLTVANPAVLDKVQLA
jgi:D-3-phosphoglycerate dehydrogenase